LEQGIDIATFTSSSMVRNLVKLLDGNIGLLDGVTIGCIGPITAATAGELGLKVDIVARVHTIAGLLDALEEYFTEEGRSP
jgi:uroporphyrinogen-III synthase